MAKSRDTNEEHGSSIDDGSVQGQAISELVEKYENLESEYIRLADQVQTLMNNRPRFDPTTVRFALIQGGVIAAIQQGGLTLLTTNAQTVDQYVEMVERIGNLVIDRMFKKSEAVPQVMEAATEVRQVF